MPISLNDDQRLDWLRLIRSESVGPRTFRALLNRFGGARAALEALPEVSRRAGRPVAPYDLADAERELAQAARLGVRFVALGEAEYPPALQAIDSAPPLIAVRGRAEALRRPAIGIVGSRNASALGLKFAGMLARAFAEAGYVVVSGLARGVDTAAHEASAEAGTVAVFAGGADVIWPPQNEGLAGRILGAGAIVSEMPLGWQPRSRDFPRRNRLVSGMALGVVVVEAARGSGSLITARFALEQGREVFAVPGSPLDPRATGANDLIRQGATLCADPAHVLEALQPQFEFGLAGSGGVSGVAEPEARREFPRPLWDELPLQELAQAPTAVAGGDDLPGLAPESASDAPDGAGVVIGASLCARLVELIGPTPVAIDDLIRASGGSAREVQQALLEMELAGVAVRHLGQRVSRSP